MAGLQLACSGQSLLSRLQFATVLVTTVNYAGALVTTISCRTQSRTPATCQASRLPHNARPTHIEA